MTTPPLSDCVVIVGRSAAERSVVAAAFRRSGSKVIDLERGAELDLPTLRQATMVVALEHHAFIEQSLLEAQAYGFYPTFLPIVLEAGATSNVATADDDAAAASIPTEAAAEHVLALEAQIAALQERLRLYDASEPEAFLTLEEQAAADPFHDKPLPSWDEDEEDGSTQVEVQSLYDLQPELDPKNSDPGDLSVLESAAPPWQVLVGALALLAGLAYFLFAPEPPPTPAELAAVEAANIHHAERHAYRQAEHLVYRARRMAREARDEQGVQSVACQRLLDEGQAELAAIVCQRAHSTSEGRAAGLYGRALMANNAFDGAEQVLKLRIAQEPNDRDALRALVELYRRQGAVDEERRALRDLLHAERQHDPTAVIRARLELLGDSLLDDEEEHVDGSGAAIDDDAAGTVPADVPTP